MGYLEDYPDYMTQGETLEELRDNLKDICMEITSGQIPCIHKVGELDLANPKTSKNPANT